MVAGGFLWGTKSWTRPNWRSFSFWTWPLFIVMWGRIGGYNTPSPSEKNGCRCAGRDWACSGSTASPSPSCTSCGPGPACTPGATYQIFYIMYLVYVISHILDIIYQIDQACAPLSGSSSPATNPLEENQYYQMTLKEQCLNLLYNSDLVYRCRTWDRSIWASVKEWTRKSTWFIVVEHEEELDEPGQLDCLEHLPDEPQLAEIDDEPAGGEFCSVFCEICFREIFF